MIGDSTTRSDFKDEMSPYLVVLLQYSLWLTMNGRDAVKLVREAVAEAYHSWNESMPVEKCQLWLREILTRRFLDGNQQQTLSPKLLPSNRANDTLPTNDRLSPAASTSTRQQLWLTGESDEDVNYLEAIASLPSAFRSAMILSYLEGFSNSEIAGLTGGQPKAIESWLSRGRALLGNELLAHLMDHHDVNMDAESEAASA